MKNRILMMAAAAAAFAAPMIPGQRSTAQSAVPVIAQLAGSAVLLPQGGISTLVEAVLAGRGGGGGAAYKPTHGGRGHTVAHGQRMARKRRNRLRAKGQFRQAVR